MGAEGRSGRRRRNGGAGDAASGRVVAARGARSALSAQAGGKRKVAENPRHQREGTMMEKGRIPIALVGLALAASLAQAQTPTYPTRAITIVVPAAPRGVSDVLALAPS